MWFQQKKKTSDLSDEELLNKHKTSPSGEYFSELFSRYIPLLYGVCLDYLRDEDKARDAVMQLYEDLLPKLSRYEITVFRTWLYSVVKNHCLKILSKEKKEILVDFNAVVMESDEILYQLNEENAREEQFEALNRCMDKLPEAQRISIKCFFINEMSYADIVEETGFSLSKVKSYIQNGKRNLKNCMDRQLI